MLPAKICPGSGHNHLPNLSAKGVSLSIYYPLYSNFHFASLIRSGFNFVNLTMYSKTDCDIHCFSYTIFLSSFIVRKLEAVVSIGNFWSRYQVTGGPTDTVYQTTTSGEFLCVVLCLCKTLVNARNNILIVWCQGPPGHFLILDSGRVLNS